MKSLSFHPEITEDIKASYEWYEEQSAGLGLSFVDELEKSYEAISNFPKSWSPFRFGFKRYILSRFPFSVVYKEEQETIFVIAVMHNSRNPKFWEARLSSE